MTDPPSMTTASSKMANFYPKDQLISYLILRSPALLLPEPTLRYLVLSWITLPIPYAWNPSFVDHPISYNENPFSLYMTNPSLIMTNSYQYHPFSHVSKPLSYHSKPFSYFLLLWPTLLLSCPTLLVRWLTLAYHDQTFSCFLHLWPTLLSRWVTLSYHPFYHVNHLFFLQRQILLISSHAKTNSFHTITSNPLPSSR